MNRLLKPLFALALALSPALAQTDAAQALDRARQAHGGAALEGLKTYQETATYSLYGPGGQVAAELGLTSYLDFARETLRLEYRQGAQVVQIIQVTPMAAQSWTAQSGTVRLPAPQAREFRDALSQGWYGLRLGGAGREAVASGGEQTFQGVKGRAVNVTTKGARAVYLFNEANQLVAEKTQNSQLGEAITLYSDYRAVSGVLLPFEGKVYAGGALVASAKVTEAKVNPAFGEATFRMP